MRPNNGGALLREAEDTLEAGMTRAQLRNAPREHFIFAHRFTFAAAGRQEFSFSVGNEAHFIAKWWGAHGTAITVGALNVYESFTLRLENSASARRYESEEVTAVTLFGTIGLPIPFTVPHLFPKTSNIRVIINNLAAGANTVDIAIGGYRLYTTLPGF